MKTPSRRWTPEEKEIISSMISQGKTHEEIAVVINRTKASVRKFCSQHKIQSSNFKAPWTEEQNEWLAANASSTTCKQAAEYLGKTYNAVALHASEMGVSFAKDTSRRWSIGEIGTLYTMHEQKRTNEEIADALGKSTYSIHWKKKDLGIEGFWRISESGKRFFSKSWTEEELFELYGQIETHTVPRIAKKSKRGPHAFYQKMKREGLRVGQGRITFVDLAAMINCPSPIWVTKRAREIGVISRKYGRNGMWGVTISSNDIVKIMDDLLADPGMGSFSHKKAREVREIHQEIATAGRSSDSEAADK